MTTRQTLAVALFATTTLAARAHAQAPANDTPSPASTTGTPAATDAAAPATDAATENATTENAATTQAETPVSSRYPRAVFARPLTLPSGLAMLGADMGANHDFSTVGATPIVGYGITDDLEVQVPYAFAAKDFEAKGSVAVDVGYKLLRGAVDGKLEAIARVRAGYNLLGEAATPLLLGVHVQYNLTDKLALISGYAGTQQIRISLAEDSVSMTTPIDFSLPIAVGYQATPELYLQFDTKLAQINISDSANAFIGADATPVALTAVYNVIPALDVQAAIGTDLSNTPGDTLTFLVGARYYAGQL